MDFGRQSTVTALGSADWQRQLRVGGTVEVEVYGQTMAGPIQAVHSDGITVRIAPDSQTADVRRFTVYGSATISLENAAATVPVSVRAISDEVRLQFIGPAEVVQRRRYARISISLPVTLTWFGDASGSWEGASSRTQDLSEGGARIAPVKTVWPTGGRLVLMSIALPQGLAELSARVIGKTQEYGLRVEFHGIDEDILDEVRQMTR